MSYRLPYSSLGIRYVEISSKSIPDLKFSTLRIAIPQISSDVRIDLTERDRGTILLKDFDIADLDAGDFLF